MGSKTFAGLGVLIPAGSGSLSAVQIDACTRPGNLACIYWGEHLTINDTPTCPIRVKNNTSAPIRLSMTATLNGLDVTGIPPISSRAFGISWNKEGATLNPGQTVDATVRLRIPRVMVVGDYPFVTQVTITGTP